MSFNPQKALTDQELDMLFANLFDQTTWNAENEPQKPLDILA